MHELTEATVNDFIKDNKNAVVKGWQENCQPCADYAPIFEAAEGPAVDVAFGSIKIAKDGPSEFRRTYMKAEKGEQIGAPMTFLFKNGEMIARHYGKMEAQQLDLFITRNLKDYTLEELHTIKGRCHTTIEIANDDLQHATDELLWANARISAIHIASRQAKSVA